MAPTIWTAPFCRSPCRILQIRSDGFHGHVGVDGATGLMKRRHARVRGGRNVSISILLLFLWRSDESWSHQIQFLNIWLFRSFFDCFCYSKLIFWGWRQQWKDKCVRDEYSFFSQEFRKKTNWEGRKGKTKWRWNRKTELDVKGRKIDQKEQVRKIQETIACNGDSDRE